MALVYLRNAGDQYKITQIRETALIRGLIFCKPEKAPHICLRYNTANAVLVCYHEEYRQALSDILTEVFEEFGPEHFELEEDTSVEEFIEIKLNTCICGLSTLEC